LYAQYKKIYDLINSIYLLLSGNGDTKKNTREMFFSLVKFISFSLKYPELSTREKELTIIHSQLEIERRAINPVCFTICNCLEEIISFKTIYRIGVCIRVEPRSRDPRHVPFWRDSLSVRFGYRVVFLRHSPSRRTDLYYQFDDDFDE